jgi:hypothetical protein
VIAIPASGVVQFLPDRPALLIGGENMPLVAHVVLLSGGVVGLRICRFGPNFFGSLFDRVAGMKAGRHEGRKA